MAAKNLGVTKLTPPRVTDGLVEIEPDAGERHLILANVIEDVSAAMKRLLASGLNRRAIEVLVRDSAPGVGLADIRAVLDALEGLKARYCGR